LETFKWFLRLDRLDIFSVSDSASLADPGKPKLHMADRGNWKTYLQYDYCCAKPDAGYSTAYLIKPK
jgi:hypothetical protein